MTFWRAFAADRRGAAAVEQALLVALVALVVTAGLAALGTDMERVLAGLNRALVTVTLAGERV